MEQSGDNALVRLVTTFEGHSLTIIEIGGEPHWLARQVGEALGYTDNGRSFTTRLTGEWSDELVADVDYHLLTGESLATVKALLGPEVIAPNTPSLLILTQQGVFAAAMLSRQPKARELRRWLSAEVLPQIAATGGYQLPPRQLPTVPALPDVRLVRIRIIAELYAARALAPAVAAWEMSRTVLPEHNMPPTADFAGDQPDIDVMNARIPWLPPLPEFRLKHADWPEIMESLHTVNDTAAQVDMRWLIEEDGSRQLPRREALSARWRRPSAELGSLLDLRNEHRWLMKSQIKGRARGDGRKVEWLSVLVERTQLLALADWPAIVEQLQAANEEWPDPAMELDAIFLCHQRWPITRAELVRRWGYDDVASVDPERFLAPCLVTRGGA